MAVRTWSSTSSTRSIWVAGDGERRLDLQHVAQAGVPGRAEHDAQVHGPPVDLGGLGRGGLPGLPVADQLDADEQSGAADVADQPVPGLHLQQAVGGVLAHLGAGLEQVVALAAPPARPARRPG